MYTVIKWIRSNFSTSLLIGLVVALLVFPGFKALVLKAFIKTGLFRPDTTMTVQDNAIFTGRFRSSQGKQYTADSLKGKVTFINFWATWCPPCIAEMEGIQSLYLSFKDNPQALFLMVDADNNLSKSVSFMEKKQLRLPVYIYSGHLPAEWYAGSLPTTIVLDKNGKMIYHHEGMADYSDKKFQEFLQQQLNTQL